LFSGAAPRALFAFMPPPERHAALRDFRPQVDEAPAPAVADFDADMAVVHRRGYAVSDEDVTPGIAALGAPVFNHRGEVVAAISISGLRSQIVGESRERNVDLLLQQASAVSATPRVRRHGRGRP
jgi:DNA-binding IclR family transcriptional regulator